MSEKKQELLQNSEGQIDIYNIIRALLRDWWMILTAGLVGAFLAYVLVSVTYTPVYTSNTTFIVSSKGATSNLSDMTAANQMAETFGEILNSRLLKKKVQAELNLTYIPGEISTMVVPDTNLLVLTVSAPSPEDSFRIMDSIINNYSEITEHVLSNVVLEVFEPPMLPAAPSNAVSFKHEMTKYGLAAMVLMALLLAFITYIRDDIKNEKDVERKLDTPLIATVYHEVKNKSIRGLFRNKKKSILITGPTTGFQFTETFKKIRSKLVYKADMLNGKVILVTSVLENEGKSTVATNIALSLAQKSDKVLLIDGDLRRPAIYKVLEKEVAKEDEISAYIRGRVPLKSIMHRDPDTNLLLILGSRSCARSVEMVSSIEMKQLIQAARATMDYVIIDSPPTALMADTEVLAEYADMSLLVVRQERAVTRDINDAIDVLENSKSELLGCIFNNVKTGIFKGKKSWGNYSYGYSKKGYYGKYAHRKNDKS